MTEEKKEITVSIVEDDNEIRKMLSLIIDRTPGYSCKQTYSDCESAIEAITKKPTDVVLMDIHLPGMSGIEGVQLLKEKLPETDFIMLTIQEDNESVFNSLCAGATGYLLKDTPPILLLNAIKEVKEGGSPMTPGIARRITTSFPISTSLLAFSKTISATWTWRSAGSSKVEEITSPLTDRCMSVTSSGRSSINKTMSMISGKFVVMALAIF